MNLLMLHSFALNAFFSKRLIPESSTSRYNNIVMIKLDELFFHLRVALEPPLKVVPITLIRQIATYI